MSILNVKYAVVNADCTAFIYVKMGRPAKSDLPMISGMSDTMQGCVQIIETFRRGLAKQILRAQEDVDLAKNDTNPRFTPEHRAQRIKNKEDWVLRLEAMYKAEYHVVELQALVVV
jgi:hypothetical protein